MVQAFNLLQHIRGFLASHFSTFCSSHAYENEGRYSSHGVFIPPKSVLLTSNENKKNKYVWTKHASPCIVDEGLSVAITNIPTSSNTFITAKMHSTVQNVNE